MKVAMKGADNLVEPLRGTTFSKQRLTQRAENSPPGLRYSMVKENIRQLANQSACGWKQLRHGYAG